MILKCLEDITSETPLYGEDMEVVDIKVDLIKKDLVTRMFIEPDQLIAYKQYSTEKGTLHKDRCIANIQGFGNIIVKHSFKELYNMKKQANQNIVIHGFKRK